jgi:heme exporter protein CcmD
MDDLGYIVASYALTLAGIAALARWTLRRGRRLSRSLPREDLPWT